ncbi:hypothetical protein HAX54_004885, partial [Datura stramonium]|nr:hypothetical protein [Datura stramonium]
VHDRVMSLVINDIPDDVPVQGSKLEGPSQLQLKLLSSESEVAILIILVFLSKLTHKGCF